jgi:hypothetical protein
LEIGERRVWVEVHGQDRDLIKIILFAREKATEKLKFILEI